MISYRVIFALAALYNLAFGAWAVLFPNAFFTLFDLPLPRHPWIWSCLGMVVGVYGLAYAWAAWEPEKADALIAVGLLGKLLGPIGWAWNVASGELPPRTFPLIVFNDLIWWFPFLLYLLRDSRRRAEIVCAVSFAVHGVACMSLLSVSGGTEAVADDRDRQEWIVLFARSWAVNWFIWAIASLSLGAFFVVWGRAVVESVEESKRAKVRVAVVAGCAIAIVGIPFDLLNESLAIVQLTRPALSDAEFAAAARTCGLLGAGVANGLYCVGGLVVSLTALRTGFQTGTAAGVGFAMWLVGMSLTVAAIFDHRPTMIAGGGLTMVLFLVFTVLTARRVGAGRDDAAAAATTA